MAHAALRAETAAQLAVARVAVVQGTETVGEALQRLRGQPFDEIDSAFVVDADPRLVGAVPLAALLAAPDEAQVADWARPATFVRAGTDQEHVAMQAVRNGAPGRSQPDRLLRDRERGPSPLRSRRR